MPSCPVVQSRWTSTPHWRFSDSSVRLSSLVGLGHSANHLLNRIVNERLVIWSLTRPNDSLSLQSKAYDSCTPIHSNDKTIP